MSVDTNIPSADSTAEASLPISAAAAQLTPDALLRLAAGKTTATLLELALDLDLFAKLKGRTVALGDLAEVWGMPGPSARLVAQYLANAGLLIFHGGRLQNGPLAEATLTADSPLRRGLALPLKYDLSLDELRAQLLDPPALHWYQLRDGGAITDDRPLIRQEHDQWVRELAVQRHGMRVQRGQLLAKTYDFAAHRHLVDLGGASGGYCLGIRQLNPHLKCTVFDLEDAANVARELIEKAGESEHIAVSPGSFFTHDLPQGDAILIANVLHTWSPEDDRVILAKAIEALEPGGTLMVRECFFEDDWSGSIEAVFDGFVLVGKEGQSGWQPSYSDMEAMLQEAGLVEIERRPDLVLGKKPA